MKGVFETINGRRSVREYKEEQLDDSELQKILDAGIMAPTARGEQPWHFTIIRNREIIKRISDGSKELMKTSGDEFFEKIGNSPMDLSHGAPTMIIVSGKIGASNIQADCGAATQNILLAAEAMGIGSCWIGLVAWYFKLEENVKKINVPSGYEVLYGISLGYKAKENEDAPKRNRDVFNWIK